MDPLTLKAIQTVLSALGDLALLIIAPIMVWNSIKLIKIDIEFNSHVTWAKEATAYMERRFAKIEENVEKIRAGG